MNPIETFNWGLIGPGGIAHRFAAAVNGLPGARLQAVLARDAQRGATFADARVFESEHTGITLQDGRADRLSQGASTGLGVRVLKDHAWGFASVSDFDRDSAFEALERKPFRSFWKKEDGAYLLRVEVIKEKPELSGRLEVESEVLKEGDLHLRSCPRCGLPLDLSHLEWREEEGMIIDRRRGMRMINLDGYTPRLVNRELVRELGEEVIPIIIDAKRDYTLKMLKDLGIRSGEDDKARLEALRDMLSLLPLYGWGMASETEYTPGGTLRVWVDNPFDEYLIAGRLAAFYEAAEGKRARVEWRDSGPASITYVLTPSISPA